MAKLLNHKIRGQRSSHTRPECERSMFMFPLSAKIQGKSLNHEIRSQLPIITYVKRCIVPEYANAIN